MAKIHAEILGGHVGTRWHMRQQNGRSSFPAIKKKPSGNLLQKQTNSGGFPFSLHQNKNTSQWQAGNHVSAVTANMVGETHLHAPHVTMFLCCPHDSTLGVVYQETVQLMTIILSMNGLTVISGI